MLLACCYDGASMELRRGYDGVTMELGLFCGPGRPFGASNQRHAPQSRPGFDGALLDVIQRTSHLTSIEAWPVVSVTAASCSGEPTRLGLVPGLYV